MSEKEMMTLKITLIRLTKPYELKGDLEAAAIVTAICEQPTTESAIKKRILRKMYTPGVHFRETSGKMRLWNREAIISTELKRSETI